MKDREVHSAVVRWLSSLIEPKVIKAYQDTKRPSKPYVMVNMTAVAEVRVHAQFDDYADVDSDVIATPQIETEWRFSLHAYGDEPTDVLRPVRSAVQLAQKNEPLMPGLIVHEVSLIRHIPEFVNNIWEPRAQMDLFVRGIVKDGFVIDVIEEHSFDFERV